MIKGLETAIAALVTVRHIYSNGIALGRDELVDQIIRALRQEGEVTAAPLLTGIAEAIEDGRIHTSSLVETV